MFELFDSVEELEERIKGMSARWQPSGEPVMQKSFLRGDATATVAYLDYNMVYVADWEDEPVLWQFAQSKAAVDFYMEQLAAFSDGKEVRVSEEREALREARVMKRTEEVEK